MILTPDATNFDKVMGGRMGPGDTITPHQQLIGVKSGTWLHLLRLVLLPTIKRATHCQQGGGSRNICASVINRL